MAKSKGKSLVIVESPAKARTLSNILGKEFDVKASVGHVRDLPKSQLGVDVERDFAPKYLIPKDKKEIVKGLKEAARKASVVYLATDPDREGEAISWHLAQAIELDGKPYERVEFHEITTDAVKSAFEHPRKIDMRLVDAQQGRRVLDRLVGYKVSRVLWNKIRWGLSAGRVQSVALRMVVDREREIQAFVPQEYWTIDTRLARVADADDAAFTARLAALPGQKKAEIGGGDQAQAVAADLRASAFSVRDVKKKQQVRRPAPPFTTSTLQQEASRRFGFSAKRTMAVAQQLYEGLEIPGEGQVGLITYMRTDSLNIAQVAREEARAFIAGKYGGDFVPAQPRFYKTKAKGAQEAHEAVRPTSVRREPAAIRKALSADQHKLYTLVWQRMVASQMADAVFDQVSVEIDARAPSQDQPYLLRASASHLRFPGFRQVCIRSTSWRARLMSPTALIVRDAPSGATDPGGAVDVAVAVGVAVGVRDSVAVADGPATPGVTETTPVGGASGAPAGEAHAATTNVSAASTQAPVNPLARFFTASAPSSPRQPHTPAR